MVLSKPGQIKFTAHWPNLLCLGTVHHDPAGYGLLLRRLEILQPDLILLELSPYGRRFRRNRQRDYLRGLAEGLRVAACHAKISVRDAWKHPEIDAIRRQISHPFEYRAARSFAGHRKIPVILVDHSLFSMHRILQWPALIDADNILQLLSAPSRRPSVPRQYRLAQASLYSHSRHPCETIPCLSDEELQTWSVREHHMAARIIKHLQAGRAQKPLFIGGWRHLSAAGTQPSLRLLLSLSAAQCLLLRTQAGGRVLSAIEPIIPAETIAGARKMC